MRHPPETRSRAASLFEAGVSRAEVARRLRIARSTASNWHRRWLESTPPARSGPRPRLSREQLRAIGPALLDSPRAHGLPIDAWSLTSVAALIHDRTGVQYHARHVSRLVRRMGWLVPPFGRSSGAAVYAHPVADPSGNRLNLLVRR